MAKGYYILICLFLTLLNPCYSQQGDIRSKVRKYYHTKIGVRELTGKNDGIQVEQYLKYVWLKKGQPWCAAFVSWCFGYNGVKKARSGGCVKLMEQGKVIYINGKAKQKPRPADVFFIWFSNLKRVAHTGFVDDWGETWVTTVEGNTNDAGSREGDGVYKKKRLKRQIYAVCNYID